MANRDVQIEVEGLKQLVKNLKAADAELVKELKAANKEAAEVVAVAARYLVPVKTGALKKSVRASGTQKAGSVRVGSARLPYAGPIHFGWPKRHIRPQPFIYEALDKRIREVVNLYEERVGKIVDSINSG